MSHKIKIAPSILSCNFANLGEEIKKATAAGADYIHLDVMDGSFVPNITFGAPVIKVAKSYSELPFDTHLMINNPERHIEAFAKAGCDIITVHAEAVTHLDRVISQIHSHGVKAGVSIVPSTHESVLEYVMDKVDLILVMTVNPGFGGQEFLHSQLHKIEKVRSMIEKTGRKIDLEVDGGINSETAKLSINAGANVLVAGTAVFGTNDYKNNIEKLRA